MWPRAYLPRLGCTRHHPPSLAAEGRGSHNFKAHLHPTLAFWKPPPLFLRLPENPSAPQCLLPAPSISELARGKEKLCAPSGSRGAWRRKGYGGVYSTRGWFLLLHNRGSTATQQGIIKQRAFAQKHQAAPTVARNLGREAKQSANFKIKVLFPCPVRRVRR